MAGRYNRQSGRSGGQGTGSPGRGQGKGRGPGKKGGRGRRMGGQRAPGSSGDCICPNCGYRVPHIAGQSCNQKECPQCGTIMKSI